VLKNGERKVQKLIEFLKDWIKEEISKDNESSEGKNE
jgi:uncharacterized protein YfdQ (DUF2303 family)